MRRLLFLVAMGWSSGVAPAHGQRVPALEGLLSVQPDPAGCIDEPALRARVAHWLEPRALVPAASLRVLVSAAPIAFTLQRDGRDVARRRFGPLPVQCSHRLDALALAIAVALEQLARAEPSAFEPSAARAERAPQSANPGATPESTQPENAKPENAEPENAKPEPVTPRTDASARAASERRDGARGASGALVAHAALWLEALPEAAAALGLGLELGTELGTELGIGELRFAAIALASAETDTALEAGRARARLFGGRVHACLVLVAIVPDLHAEPCAGVIAGAVSARGDDFPVEKRTTLPYVAPLLRLALRYPARSAVSLRIAVDGLLNAVRPELQVSGPSTVSDSTALFGAAPSLELLVELP